MKISILKTLPLVLQGVSAHYTFSRLIINGISSDHWEYIRNVAPHEPSATQFHPEFSKSTPQLGHPDLTSTNITCGRNAFASAATTNTAVIPAGSDLGFGIHIEATGHYVPLERITHRGPAMIWLARAPNDDLENFSGINGDWFKIDYRGPVDDNNWETYNETEVHFSIPEAVPPGRYLLRIEHIWLFPYTINPSQWYVNCAHIEITGNGNGVPPPGSKIPGLYHLSTPGLWVTNEQADLMGPVGLLEYEPPLPPVWRG